MHWDTGKIVGIRRRNVVVCGYRKWYIDRYICRYKDINMRDDREGRR